MIKLKVPKLTMPTLDTKSASNKLLEAIKKANQKAVSTSKLSPEQKKCATKALKVTLKGYQIQLTSEDPKLNFLLKGQKKGIMSWLNPKPIKITTKDGKILFRTPTPKSLRNGGWIHPGRKAQPVIEKTVEIYKKMSKTNIKKAFLK